MSTSEQSTPPGGGSLSAGLSWNGKHPESPIIFQLRPIELDSRSMDSGNTLRDICKQCICNEQLGMLDHSPHGGRF